jgi:hypothetical protein
MFHLWYFNLFTYTGFQHDFHFKYCSCGLTITRRLILVEQELLTHPGHLSSSPICSRIRVVLSLCVLCSVLWIINCPLVLFPLAIVLSVLWLPLYLVSSSYSCQARQKRWTCYTKMKSFVCCLPLSTTYLSI